MNVPFLDLKAQYRNIKSEVLPAIEEVCENTAFAGGPYVAKFEEQFAQFCNVSHCAAVGNGTDALWLAFLALGITCGDEVITVPDTFIATAEAISLTGAKPVFVDVEETTYNMDPSRIEAAITPRTKAIVPVHLFGQTADMDPILAIARKHKLFVVEDASQAHGALYKGKPAGSMGDAGCFSFYPGKNLGAYGEGGAVVSNKPEVIGKIKVLRDHGQPKKYMHSMIGWNARMDGIQGAVLSVKLRHLPPGNDARRAHAGHYRRLLAGIPSVRLPSEAPWAHHIYHVFAVRVPHRDAVLKTMAEKGVSCAIHYPIPLHLQEAYAHLNLPKGTYPVSERCQSEFLSLPMFPELTAEQVDYTAKCLKECVQAT